MPYSQVNIEVKKMPRKKGGKKKGGQTEQTG